MQNEAFEDAARAHKDRIHGYAAHLLRDVEEARDVAQEALVKLWQHWNKVDEQGRRTWLMRTTHNLCIDRIRRRKVRGEVDGETVIPLQPDKAPGPTRLAESNQLSDVIEKALAALPADDLWWRPHPGVISFGTILLHLEGNVRQWLLSGLGGEPDHRDRSCEFAATSGAPGPVLLESLRATVHAACDVIDGCNEERLATTYLIQGARPTGLQAIYHVVEHFSWHTGQAVWIAKGRSGPGHDVSFYDDDAINAARNG